MDAIVSTSAGREAMPYWGAPKSSGGYLCTCTLSEQQQRLVDAAPPMFGPCRCAGCGGDIVRGDPEREDLGG